VIRVAASLAALLFLLGAPSALGDSGYPEITVTGVTVSTQTATYSGGVDFCATDTKCQEGVYTVFTSTCSYPPGWSTSGGYVTTTSGTWQGDGVAVGYWEDVSGGYLKKTIFEHRGACGAFTPFLYGSSKRDCKHTEYAYAVSLRKISNDQLSWSPAYKVTLPKLNCKGASGGSSGSSGSGGAGAGSGASSGASVKVTLSAPVTITHKDGTLTKTSQPALIKAFDQFRTGSTPVSISLPSGKMVLDKSTKMEYTPGTAATWTLKSGKAYFDTKTPVSMATGYARASGTGKFSIQDEFGNQEAYRSYGGDLAVTYRSKTVTIHTGQQAWIAGDSAAVSRFKPPAKPFWK